MASTSRTTGQPRAGCSKRLSSKAAVSEEARRTLRYVELLSEARTPLADFFSILLMGFKRALIFVVLSLSVGTSFVQAESPKNIQDHGKAMLRDAEDMVMHGGMGDGKAIVYHCGEVAKHAQAILKALPPTDEHGQEAVPHLQEAIKQCKRVAEMGDKVDPGASLNPATKARAAAREAMKHLMAMKDNGA